MPEKFQHPWAVVPLTKAQCEPFVTKKHYSRRASIFWSGFGLVIEGMVEGVCVFGQPSPPIQRHAFRNRDFKLLELARLVIQTKERNAASFLIGRSLRLLTPPCAVVSYADTEFGHAGIVYQATNWIYTGATRSHDKTYLVNGTRTHPMTLRDKGITNPTAWARENGVQMVPPADKHRYFKLVGSKRQVKEMLEKLAYPIINEYPKLPKSRYDDGSRIEMKITP